MNNISLGRYSQYDTLLHRMDPRGKIVSMIICMVMVFFSYGSLWTNLIVYAFLMVGIYILMRIAHISLKQLFKQLKVVWMMMIIILIINYKFI